MDSGNQIIKRFYNYLIFLIIPTAFFIILSGCAQNAPLDPHTSEYEELTDVLKKETQNEEQITKNIDENEPGDGSGQNKEKRRIRSASRYGVAYSDTPVSY